ncbi:hypothetical protein Tco_1477008 [Tanacetum coccineum]
MLTVAAPLPTDTTDTPSSTTIDQDAPAVSTSPTTHEIQALVNHQDVEEKLQGIQSVEFDNAPLIHNLTPDLSFEESSSQGVIPSNLHHLNQSFDNLRKWSKDHTLDNVIGNPSLYVLTRSQLQANAIWIQKCSPSPDLPDPHHHALSPPPRCHHVTTTIIITIASSSSRHRHHHHDIITTITPTSLARVRVVCHRCPATHHLTKPSSPPQTH